MRPDEVVNAALALAACGEVARAQNMLKRYLALLPTEQASLERAYAAQDLETVQTRIHRLRSGSRYVGAERMASALQALEEALLQRAAPDARTAAWVKLKQEFQVLLEQPQEALLALLASARLKAGRE